MRIAVVNESTVAPNLTRPLLDAICAALSRQAYEHYAPFWEASGCDVFAVDNLAAVPRGASVMAILDDADQAGVLGYHDVTPNGRPYSRVFLGPVVANGGTLFEGANALSVTMSHEALETIGDPYATWWGDGPTGEEHALELCDPVEGDAYDVDGVSVSNFVGPRWFSQGAGPYDWLRKLTEPFSMTAGGYMITRTAGKDISQTFGAEYPGWKIAGKGHPAARGVKRHK